MSATSPARASAPDPHADAGGALLALTTTLDDAAADEICPRAARALREAMHAELVVVLRGGVLAGAAGAELSPEAVAELRRACEQGVDRVTLPALGELRLSAARLDSPVSWLIAGQVAATLPTAATLLPAAARILSLHLRVARAGAMTADLRRRGEREMRERKHAERELAHRSLHDELTGLANRALVRERAGLALDQARTGHLAVLFVDVDNFKLANDALDHRRGDRLLIAIAQRLTAVLSPQDRDRGRFTLARPGGDEFIVLCESLETERDAVAVAQRIHDALRAPFCVGGVPVALTASIGIAIAAAGDAHDADQMLRDADVALSRAKERGRDRYEIFDAPMRVRLLDRVAFEADLRTAIDTGQLRLHYQPVVTVTDGTLAAVEGLVRWQHPTRGLLGPGEFVPLAEEDDLIVALGAWVIEEACAQIRRWRDAHPAQLGVRVSVNVSARQLSPQLTETVTAALEAHDVSPSSLALEITESLVVEHTDSAREVLAALEQLGVAIVLDDFGTGYSSLSYLASFHVSQLKLDRSFVADLSHDARAAKIIAATIDLARALGMTVVAEGVETAEQVAVLRRLGCDFAQGFHYARPAAADAILERMRAAYEGDREIAARLATRTVEAPTRVNDADSSHRRQQVAIGRLAGWLFLAGSVVALPSDLVLGSPGPGLTAILTLMGVVSGLVCLRLPWRHVSEWWLCAAGMLATIEITTSVVAVGQHGLVLEPIYLLVATTTAYAFRDRRMIAGQIVFIVGAMAVGLLMRPTVSAGAAAFTMVMILVLIIMSALIAYLRELLEGGAAELRELAASDPLTGVGNYRRLHERLEYELLRHQRDGGRLSLLLIDLDCFKQVNERRGHAAGDDVLRRVAATLRESVRSQDTVARQGGDEFAVLSPETDLEGAAMLAARIRDRLGRVQFAGDSIGATVGWAVYPADGRTAAELLARADERLMTGKLAPKPAMAMAGAATGTVAGAVAGPVAGAGSVPPT